MPSLPEEPNNREESIETRNVESVREITQTDHLNKKLLTAYLNSINMLEDANKANGVKEDENTEEEEQNWDS